MSQVIRFLYKKILKPILFLFSADFTHSLFMLKGDVLGKISFCRYLVRKMFDFKDESLNQKIVGIDFKNPLGLAAGFDYDAKLINILPSIGFGFETVGTLTNEPYSGNPKPMLGRLPKSKSILVNKGFKNEGVEKVLARLKKTERSYPVGLSIGSTNKKYDSFQEIVADIKGGFERASFSDKYFDYYELNISCPNLINITDFTERVDSKNGLQVLLNTLKVLNIKKPVFIKMPLEKSFEEIDELVFVTSQFAFIKGLVVANLVKDRSNQYLDREELKKVGRGNFSGKPTFEKSNELISYTYQKYGKNFVIIGCGGVFSAEDAYLKIKLGATLVQLITGMIYEGPQLVGDINKGLVKLLKKDGYNNIGQAIGVFSG